MEKVCRKCGREFYDPWDMSRGGRCNKCEEPYRERNREAARRYYKRNAPQREAKRAMQDATLKGILDEILERAPGHREPTWQIDWAIAAHERTDYWNPWRVIPAMRRLRYTIERRADGRYVKGWRVIAALREAEEDTDE